MTQLPFDFLVPKSDWKAPSLSDLPQDWNRFQRISIDVETRDDLLSTMGCGARRGAYIVGYSLTWEGGPSAYLPVRHMGGGNLDARAVCAYVRENARGYTNEIVGMNLSYDLDMLAQEGIEFPNASWFRDVAVADPLLNELHDSYSLESIGTRHGIVSKDDVLLTEALQAYAPKKTAPTHLKRYLYLLPAGLVGAYAQRDTSAPLEILRIQEAQIEAQSLRRVFDLESRVLPVLVKMRRRGVRVHQARLAQVQAWAIREEEAAWNEIARLTGVRVKVGDAMKAVTLAPILDSISVPYTMGGAKGTIPSIDKFLLESIEHPAGALLRRARKMSQLRTTFVASVIEHLINGRIHCTFNQLRKSKESGDGTEGVGPGRLSSSQINMQQQPARDPEIGPMWRSIYLPEEETGWGSLDFSQQEPKWLIDCSSRAPIGDPWRKRGDRLGISARARDAALAAASRYRSNPNLDAYDDFCRSVFGNVTKPLRSRTKEIYLARVYGMGGPRTCAQMGLPTAIGKDWRGRECEVAGTEAQRLLDQFDGSVPYAREMSQMLSTLANERGYVVTYSGRRVHYPVFEGRYADTQKGLNNLVQGSSADETKEALVQMDAAGYFLQLQVHDELDGSFETRADAEAAADIMRHAVPKCLPTKVDVDFGNSWGEAK